MTTPIPTPQMRFSDGSVVPPFLEIAQVAQLFGISEGSVRRAIDNGELYAKKFTARQFRVAQEDAMAWFNAEKQG